MPILDIEIILKPGESVQREHVAEIADRAAELFDTPAGGTWVKVRTLSVDAYAENGGGPSEGVYPVFVAVLKAKIPPPSEMSAEVTRLTTAVAQVFSRPRENVHILYLPEAAGRIAFGGSIVTA